MTSEFVAGDLTYAIIGAFHEVYNELGFGFLESVYRAALVRMLRSRGIGVATEVRVPVYFRNEIIAQQRLDIIVEDIVVVELKATEVLSKHAPRQLRNYLAATRLPVGLLLHFAPTGAIVHRRTNH
jgi:GxxExxY protein